MEIRPATRRFKSALISLLLVFVVTLSSSTPARVFTRGPSGDALSPARIQAVLNEALAKYKDERSGANADYIPVLGQMPSDLFAIAIVTPDGRVYSVGDTGQQFSIQSISKVFTFAEVLKESGINAVADNIGVDATGAVFNSITAIEQHNGQEINPFVNPGAIATTSMVKGNDANEVWSKIIGNYDDFAGRKLDVLDDVYKSESATNQRNQAIGMLMYAYGRIKEKPDQATDLYTRQCSVGVNTRDLAVMAGTLANGGINPVTHRIVVSPENVESILAVMATAGLYDDSGQWLVKTGLPAKSGVGGGIIAVSPGKFGIAAFSPRLDKAGNSVRAQLAIEYISNALHGNPYEIQARAR